MLHIMSSQYNVFIGMRKAIYIWNYRVKTAVLSLEAGCVNYKQNSKCNDSLVV